MKPAWGFLDWAPKAEGKVVKPSSLIKLLLVTTFYQTDLFFLLILYLSFPDCISKSPVAAEPGGWTSFDHLKYKKCENILYFNFSWIFGFYIFIFMDSVFFLVDSASRLTIWSPDVNRNDQMGRSTILTGFYEKRNLVLNQVCKKKI